MNQTQPGLAEAALQIAQWAYPELDIQHVLSTLDEYAVEVKKRLTLGDRPYDILVQMNRYLFVEQGYSKNIENLRDPRNSYLNDVIERKQGLPIALSVLYINLGRRLGLSLEGVSFPGHFLVKHEVGDHQIIIDPFSRGLFLDHTQLEERLTQVLGINQAMQVDVQDFLAAASQEDILLRMLRNLRMQFIQKKEYTQALDLVELGLRISPDAPDEVRDRGLLYQLLEVPHAALPDLKRYLKLRPKAPDKDTVTEWIHKLEAADIRLH